MKKSNAQAETHSQPAGALRTSPAFCYFFYFYLDYKHKHTATGQELYCAHALYVWNFFYFLDYKHKRRPRAGVKHQAKTDRVTCFFIDFLEYPI